MYASNILIVRWLIDGNKNPRDESPGDFVLWIIVLTSVEASLLYGLRTEVRGIITHDLLTKFTHLVNPTTKILLFEPRAHIVAVGIGA